MYLPHVFLVSGEVRRGKSDPLERELQMVVSRHVDAWNQTCVLCKSNKCSKARSHLCSPSSRGFSLTGLLHCPVPMRIRSIYSPGMAAAVFVHKDWRDEGGRLVHTKVTAHSEECHGLTIPVTHRNFQHPGQEAIPLHTQ